MIRVTIEETDTRLGHRFTIDELGRMNAACIEAEKYMRRRCETCGDVLESRLPPPDKYKGVLMTTAEAARYTGLTKNVIYNAVRHKMLTAHRQDGDGRNYYRRDELDELVKCREGGWKR